jgi:peptide chain release factor 2
LKKELSELESLLIEDKEDLSKSKLRYIYFNFCVENYENISKSVIMSIYAGTGGKDAEDWVRLLWEMYSKFLEKQRISYKVNDEDKNEYGGLKYIEVNIEGENIYDILKYEKGVHRLVRISPFSAKKLRHTSFAYVEILPFIEDPKIEIKEEDLTVDTFRSSGKGGQNVNKVETAVRITYKPLNIVVTCQSERTQHQNKQLAIKILKSKILNFMKEQKAKKIEELKGKKLEISWGNQKRSYIFDPYNLVKDHQFNIETNKVDEVLNGNLSLIHPLGAILL